MGRGVMGAATAPTGFQAPEPYVPESAKAAGALYEAGISPSDINALQQAAPAPFDPVAYRNQFKPDSGGLASVAQPTPIEPVNLTGAVPTVVPPQTQQIPSFYQQPMGMMPQPFNPMGYGPMGMGMGMNRFMNPYGGGLGGMAYNFMNRPMPLYGQGGQFTAGEYKAPEPTAPTQPSFGFSPYGSFSYY